MARILIAEDDRGISDFISRGLRGEGYDCDIVEAGPNAFAAARSGDYDLVILDLGLPHMDGADVLEQLRALGVTIPIIVLTARTNIEARVRSLEGGADDYMPKPFQFAELAARVRLRLHKADSAPPAAEDSASHLTHGDMHLDLRAQRVKLGDKFKDLSRRETALLEAFMRNPDDVLTRAQLLKTVWDMDFDPGSNVVDVYVRTLRKKVGSERIETVRGAGYRLAPAEPA